MSYNCEVTDRPDQHTLSIRTRAPVEALPQTLGKAYGEISQYLSAIGQAPAGAPFVAYFNMDMQDLDMEIGFPVPRQIPGQGEIQSGTIPAGKYAVCLYVVPYKDVGSAYEDLAQFVVESGYEPTGVSYEYYLNDPTDTPPEALQTQVVFPLKGK
jgi:effector-binding domain-containing protein